MAAVDDGVPLSMAWIGDHTPYQNRQAVLARFLTGQILGLACGQLMGGLLADLATDLAMSDRWLDYLAGLIDSGAKDFGVEASMAKMRASDLAMRAATEAVQMFGGYGYCRDYRVERLMRDAKITQIWEGTNQVHRQLIGRSFAAK